MTLQIDRLMRENNKLLDALISKEKPESDFNSETPKPIPPKTIPWSVKKQMLEQESRDNLRLMQTKLKEMTPTNTDELEEEILNAKVEA